MPHVCSSASGSPLVVIDGILIFQEHHRCELNCGLDSGVLHLLDKALPGDQLTHMRMGLAKAIICTQDGMIQELEEVYQKKCGRDLWDDSNF